MKKLLVTIDGPAASGKGRIAKYVSKKWKLFHLDSGVLYRRIALLISEKKINLNQVTTIKKIISSQKSISLRNHKKLRSEEISKIASKIAVFGFVREKINKLQREIVKNNINKRGFVVDGRDIGSIVFKNADLKLYIDVNERNRAKRRFKQLIDSGEKSIYPKILKDIKLRDKKDKTRKNSPLIVPDGAVIINNNESFKNTTDQVNNQIRKILK